MEKCDDHGIEWDVHTYTACPMCTFVKQIDYPYTSDLRRCHEHVLITFYDVDIGCAACKLKGDRDPSDPPAGDQSLDNKIKDLKRRAEDIITARAERELEKTGDHGRPESHELGGGYRWL